MSKPRATQKHMDRVAQLPCGVCEQSGPVELHHVLEGRTPGRKSPDWLVIPLCYDCHQGSANGIHGRKAMWAVAKKSELDVLAETLEKIYG